MSGGSTQAGSGGSVVTSGTGGVAVAGSATGGSGGSAGSAVGGSAGAGGNAGSAGSANTAGQAGGGGGGAPAGCAADPHPLCIDFESGIDTTMWKGGTTNSIVTTDHAHGTHAYQLYSCADNPPPVDGAKCNSAMSAGKLVSLSVGPIGNQIWGRFYVHFTPGAPGGHGNIVAAFDQPTQNWYEMGWQFDGMMGVWHGGGGETPLRSMPYIVDKWYCIETYFDGEAAAMPKWWIDGVEAAYYKPGGGPTVQKTTKFDRVEVGFTPYAGLGIRQPDGVGDQTEKRTLTGMWIDDVAFDTKRIGCIGN